MFIPIHLFICLYTKYSLYIHIFPKLIPLQLDEGVQVLRVC